MRHALLLVSFLPAILMAEPLRVFVSVLPIQTFVEKVGGEHVDVRAMVQPGYSPQTYDPTPQQIGALAKAALYVRTGVPFENAWMDRLRSANPRMQVLDARAGVELRDMEANEQDEKVPADSGGSRKRADATEHEGQHEYDPHVWTNPRLVKHMVGAIRNKLSALDPAHRSDYARNHDAFLRELDDLDRDIHALLDPLPYRRFMVFHPAWGYFADAYGLVQVPIEREGKEPGARTLAALIDQAKKEKVRVVFVQPQFDKRQARQVAQAIGGTVIAVDPLAPDYAGNLRRVARLLAEALQP
jgi:zinc transport system substrate-binding protein